MLFLKGKMKEPVAYDDIKLLPEDKGLMINQEYENERIELPLLIELITKLRTNPVMEVYESSNPFSFLLGG